MNLRILETVMFTKSTNIDTNINDTIVFLKLSYKPTVNYPSVREKINMTYKRKNWTTRSVGPKC